METCEAIGTDPREIRELTDGDIVDEVLLVRESEIRQTRAGAEYMRLQLADRTGVVTGIVWDDVDHASATAMAGEAVHVSGVFSCHPRYGPQVTVRSLAVPDEIDWDRLIAGPSTSVGELERELEELLLSLRDPHLIKLMDALLAADSPTGRSFRQAFAAQYNHHAYRSGLLEHSVAVARATAAAAGIFSGIDRDVAVCGALLHDIGKLDAYTGDQHSVTINDTGKLIGEIPAGYYIVRRQIEQIPGFPSELAQRVLHIILSHHGCLEYGSPVLPATREALLVHAMDQLSGDLGSFDRLERGTVAGERWSRYDRALGRSVLLSGPN
jgi:3'-5' exoribonuclease